MDEQASALVVELARHFTDTVSKLAADWEVAYFRFDEQPGAFGSAASYVMPGKVQLIGALRQAEFYATMNRLGHALFQQIGQTLGLFLLTVHADGAYDIQFEWDDLDRWQISKMDGGTGIPTRL